MTTFASRTMTVLAVLAGLAFAMVSGARGADPLEVFIDARDPAFVVVQGVATDTPETARREMAGYAALEGVSLVPWEVFRQNAGAYILPHVLKDEYPGTSLVLSLVALVQSYPGRPFAVTWNGGLAVTFQDYQHAVKTYNAYHTDPEAYDRSREGTPRLDPVDPANVLPGLLNP